MGIIYVAQVLAYSLPLKRFILFSFFKDFIYLFLETKRGRETSVCGCLSRTPYWGPGPQPRHVP